MSSWTPNRLPKDLVGKHDKRRFAFVRDLALDDPEHISENDLDRMQHEILKFVCVRNGSLILRDFLGKFYHRVEGTAREKTLGVCFNLAAPRVAPHVRKIVLDLSVLESTELHSFARLLETSPRLSDIELSTRGMSRLKQTERLATVLEGLSRNTSNRLVKISLKLNTLPLLNNQIGESFQKLVHLKTLQLRKAHRDDFLRICQALTGHSNLEYFDSGGHVCTNEFLTSLPKLKTTTTFGTPLSIRREHMPIQRLTNVQEFAFNVMDHLPDILRLAPNLVQLVMYTPWGTSIDQARAQWNSLADFAFLESLTIDNIEAEFVLKCSRLKHLSVTSHCLPSNGGQLDIMLTQHPTLESLEFRLANPFSPPSIALVNEVLRLIETSHNITALTLSCDDRTFDENNAKQLRRTLLGNRNLRTLSMPACPDCDRVLSNLLENNAVALEGLCLTCIAFDPTNILRAVRSNPVLAELTLNMSRIRDALNIKISRDFLGEISHLVHLKKLSLDFSRCNSSVDPDELATALEGNKSLVSIKVKMSSQQDSKFDFCCRLFEHRNRVQQMVTQDAFPNSLWPILLEKLFPNPSSVFLAMTYVPFPTRIGKDRSSTTENTSG